MNEGVELAGDDAFRGRGGDCARDSLAEHSVCSRAKAWETWQIQISCNSSSPSTRGVDGRYMPCLMYTLGNSPRWRCSSSADIWSWQCLPVRAPLRYRNEYLITLARMFEDSRAREALKYHERFANEFINGRLPAWFAYLWVTVRLVAPIKRAVPDTTLDVRPVGIG